MGRLVTIPMMCSCKTNLKEYVCKHFVGVMMIYFNYHIVSDPPKLEELEDLGKRRGYPQKATLALSHSRCENGDLYLLFLYFYDNIF
ncbi:unnamed protein product [Didymodactylos carnosus]|uniref:SWIM-type domain-containing protein n=1 Tax=Didymodactylos carnosus TaxID=1234261 RepID=A0A813RLF9_9BILA|nr:unnamed protein product [Didymodactylos carnosus]CAF3569652.1 unnamed protein product [Didymodactylos carnosus]